MEVFGKSIEELSRMDEVEFDKIFLGSPFRVPIARLAAARASVEHKHGAIFSGKKGKKKAEKKTKKDKKKSKKK